MKAACKTCEIREMYAKAFDIHFTEDDCPFVYDNGGCAKAERETAERSEE